MERSAIMRHSDPKLTANIYTDPALLDVGAALDALPAIPLDGADGAQNEAVAQAWETGAEKCPPKRPPFPVKSRPNLSISDNSAPGYAPKTARQADRRKAPETKPVIDSACRGKSEKAGGRYWT